MFDGHTSGSKVSLSGASRGGRHGSEGRSEFLRRQAREREDRERKRVRDKAAIKIQATVRRWRCLQAFRTSQRKVFDKRVGDISKVEAFLPGDQRAVFIFKALPHLLQSFTFFFSPSQDLQRLASVLRMARFSAEQSGTANFFRLALSDEEPQRRSNLTQSRGLLAALLTADQMREAAELLLLIRDALFAKPDLVPVHPERSAAAIGSIVRGTKVLEVLSSKSFLLALPASAPSEEDWFRAVDLMLLVCTGIEVCAQPRQLPLLLCILSAPRISDTLLRPGVQETAARSLLLRVAQLLPPAPQGEAAELKGMLREEVQGAPCRNWLVANIATWLQVYLMVADCSSDRPVVILAWLCWLKAQLMPDFWKPSDMALRASQLERLWSPALAAALPKLLDEGDSRGVLPSILNLYFQAPTGDLASPSAEVLQELAVSTSLLAALSPSAVTLARCTSVAAAMQRLSPPEFNTPAAAQFHAFCLIFAAKLRGTFDQELAAGLGPLRPAELEIVVPFLNRFACHFMLEFPDRITLGMPALALRGGLMSLVRGLYDRHRRHSFLPERLGAWWLIPELRTVLQEGPLAELSANVSGALGLSSELPTTSSMVPAAQQEGLASRVLLEKVLAEAPHMLPFEDRVALLHAMIHVDQEARQDTRADWARSALPRHRIRRDYLMEDGFAAFDSLDSQAALRAVFVVEFVAADGSTEPGIDGGGLFKEFMIYICRTAFGPEYGLFSASSDQTLYPFPGAFAMHENADKLFRFLGKVVGKAIYEMMLLEPQFSRAFLNRVLGRVNDVEDVASIDRDLHRGMLYMREHGHVEELGLSFSTSVALPGGAAEEVDLMPGGRDVAVTQEGLSKYLYLLANHRANQQIDRQSAAFLKGLECVLPLSWIRMFDPRELGILISGSSTGFDVSDLKRHTVYAGGYTDKSKVITWLWDLLENHMEPEDMGHFLMFATSCSRPPLLGFRSFNPKFCIHKVPDATRLPTASTCANLLKLPEYTSFKMLQAKVLQAIRAESGFDLS